MRPGGNRDSSPLLRKQGASHKNKSTGTELVQQRQVLKVDGSDAFIDVTVSQPDAKSNSKPRNSPKKYFAIDPQCAGAPRQKKQRTHRRSKLRPGLTPWVGSAAASSAVILSDRPANFNPFKRKSAASATPKPAAPLRPSLLRGKFRASDKKFFFCSCRVYFCAVRSVHRRETKPLFI